MLDAYPNLRGMYDENDGNTQVFYMQNATATPPSPVGNLFAPTMGKPYRKDHLWEL